MVPQDRIKNNSESQGNNSENEIKDIHNFYKFLIDKTLSDQKNNASSKPNIIVETASCLNPGITNGTTIEATQICPRFANIPEITFSCSKDSIYYYNNNSQNPVNDAMWIKLCLSRAAPSATCAPLGGAHLL